MISSAVNQKLRFFMTVSGGGFFLTTAFEDVRHRAFGHFHLRVHRTEGKGFFLDGDDGAHNAAGRDHLVAALETFDQLLLPFALLRLRANHHEIQNHQHQDQRHEKAQRRALRGRGGNRRAGDRRRRGGVRQNSIETSQVHRMKIGRPLYANDGVWQAQLAGVPFGPPPVSLQAGVFDFPGGVSPGRAAAGARPYFSCAANSSPSATASFTGRLPSARRAVPLRKETARRKRFSPVTSAKAATGLWQPPPMARSKARSDVTACKVL